LAGSMQIEVGIWSSRTWNSSYDFLQGQPSLSPLQSSGILIFWSSLTRNNSYTAGGLFRWIHNGYMTDEDFLSKLTVGLKVTSDLEATTRWEDGVQMFSIIDDL
jgi:hypothetical protein